MVTSNPTPEQMRNRIEEVLSQILSARENRQVTVRFIGNEPDKKESNHE